MNTRVVAVIAAGVLALLGVVLLVTWAQGAQERAFEGAELTEVVRVTEPVPSGSDADDLTASTETVQLPTVSVPEGAVTDLGEVTGLITTADLQPGEVLLAARLSEPGADDAESGGLPEGLQEVSVTLDTARIVGGALAVGDTVGVFASYNSPDETAVVNNEILVTSTGMAGVSEEGAATSTMTLAVSAQDAAKIVHGAEFGRLWLTKQNPTTETDDGVTDREDVVQ